MMTPAGRVAADRRRVDSDAASKQLHPLAIGTGANPAGLVRIFDYPATVPPARAGPPAWRLIARWKARRSADLAAVTEDGARELGQVL
jgi:hypothetical protein